MTVRRAGLFGGSFDPVHRAHVALADSALNALKLEEVRWVPAGQPWQKTRPMTDAVHREAMLRLATAHEPRFVLDRIELERSGPSYTLDTVRALKAAHPGTEWHLLIGHDQHAGLHTWHGWQELLEMVVLAVANRPGSAGAGTPSSAGAGTPGSAGAGTPRAVHPEVLRHGFQAVPLPLLNISATQVRALAAQGATIEALATLVPTEVAGYIYHHGLYRPAIRS